MNDDDKIAALFAAPERAPDEAFVARIQRAVLAEQKMKGARAAAWRRFAVECAASGAIVTAFYLLWRLAPATMPLDQLPVGPAAAAILVLGLWFGVELRASAAGR